MNKRICALLLGAVMLFSSVPVIAAEDAAAPAEEKVILDYGCDSLKDSVLNLRGNKYPSYYIVDSETGKNENVAAGTVYIGSDGTTRGDTSLVFPLSNMTKQTFSMKMDLKVDELITPTANSNKRGFYIDFHVPGSRNIYATFHTLGETAADGTNAIMIYKYGWHEDATSTKQITIPTDGEFHTWEFLFNGTDEIRFYIDDELQAVVQEITLNAQTPTGFLRIGSTTQDAADGTKNAITLDRITVTEGIPFSDTLILSSLPLPGSSAKALTVETELNELTDGAKVGVKVINKADKSQTAKTEYTPSELKSTVTLTDIPFTGVVTVQVSVTGGLNYTFDTYLHADIEEIGVDAALTAADTGKAYTFSEMFKIELPEKTKWKLNYTKDFAGSYGSVLTCQNIGEVYPFDIPVTLNGKFAVYVGYIKGTTRFSVNGTEVFVSYKKDGGNVICERFAMADDFKDGKVTVSNVTGNTARIAYVKFVALSDEEYDLHRKEDDSTNLMMDNDGFSIFCSASINSPYAMYNSVFKYADTINLTQVNWCTFSTSILNYDSEVWWKYVTARLKELNIPEEKWPENFLDHVNDKGEHLDFEDKMRDLDKNAYKNMLTINKEGYPHVLLADYAKENGYGDVYVSLRMSHYGANSYQTGSFYFLYPEFIRKGSFELSYSHEIYRNYLHDILMELAAPENVAGITMDFGRYPMIFGTELNDVAERTRIMNDFVKRVHDDLPEGKKLNVRVLHPTETKALAWGLNYMDWVENDWVDRIIISEQGHETFFNFAKYMDYFNQHDNVEFYLGINATLSGHDLTKEEEDLKKQGVKIESGERVATTQFLLRAYEAYAAGADGIFLFNGLDTSAVGGIDPAYARLNNKTLMEQWYEFHYPAYLFSTDVEFVKAADVPADKKAPETEKPAETTKAATTTAATTAETTAEPTETTADSTVTDAPAVSEEGGTNTVWIIIGAAAVVLIAVVSILLSKKKKS